MMMYCRSRRPQRTHIHRVKNCSNNLAPSVGTTSSFLIKKISSRCDHDASHISTIVDTVNKNNTHRLPASRPANAEDPKLAHGRSSRPPTLPFACLGAVRAQIHLNVPEHPGLAMHPLTAKLLPHPHGYDRRTLLELSTPAKNKVTIFVERGSVKKNKKKKKNKK
jgi:hypothetical protein